MKKIYRKISAVAAALSVTFSVNAFANNWVRDKNGIKYIQPDGTYATGWTWIDNDLDGYAACYYFDENGNLSQEFQTKIDGYWVNSNGEWMVNGKTQRKKVAEPYVVPFGTEPYNPAQPLRNCLDAWNLRLDNPLSPEQNPRYYWDEDSKSYSNGSMAVFSRELETAQFQGVQRMLTGQPPEVDPSLGDIAIYEWFVNWLNSFDFMNMSEEERYNEIIKVLHSVTVDPNAAPKYDDNDDPFTPAQGDPYDFNAYRVLINKRADSKAVIETTTYLCKALGLVWKADSLDNETWIRTGNDWHYIYNGNDDSKKAVASSEAGVFNKLVADRQWDHYGEMLWRYIQEHEDDDYYMDGQYRENSAR